MAFNHKFYIEKYTKTPSNDAVPYGVTIDHSQVAEGEFYWKVIGIHHLLPQENRGNRNIYIDVLDENNQRIRGTRIAWTWLGRNEAKEPANDAIVDKPDAEPGTNISIGSKQVISIWVREGRSDKVNNLKSVHPDEPGGNQLGHHSFYVIFKKTRKGVTPPPIDEEEPEVPPVIENPQPPKGFTKTISLFEDSQLKVTMVIQVK